MIPKGKKVPICDIQDDRIRVLVLRVGNRKEIYR